MDFPKLRLPPPAHRLAEDRKYSLPGLATNMGKSQEVECLRFSFSAPVSVFPRKPAKLQNPSLVRMQFQSKFPKPFIKIGQEPFGFATMLESHNEVITIAHNNNVTLRLLLPPLSDPQVEYIMKVDIGQERTDTAALNRPHLNRVGNDNAYGVFRNSIGLLSEKTEVTNLKTIKIGFQRRGKA
jgi:hypothetical protein